MSLLLGVDIGTTGLKAALVDGDGQVLAEAGREYPTQHPHPGWAEQDPDGWWRAMVAAGCEVIAGPVRRGSAWRGSASAAWRLWLSPWTSTAAAGPRADLGR